VTVSVWVPIAVAGTVSRRTEPALDQAWRYRSAWPWRDPVTSAQRTPLHRARGARTSLPDEDALVAEPEVEALVGLARCARRLRDGDDPLAVRRAIDRVRADARHAGYDYLSVQCLGLAAAAAAAGPDRP
jgi:hypothetical protein